MSGRQAQLVEVAMRILASEGPRRFTAQHLAEETGITAGAIYNHFDSMEAVADAVIDRMGAALFEGFPPEADDPITRLRLFFLHRAHVVRSHPHIARLLLTDHLARAAGASHADRVHEFKRRTQQFVAGCLREAAADGTLAADVSPEAGAVIVTGAVLFLSHAGTRVADDARPERLDEVWRAIERMLRRAPEPMRGRRARGPGTREHGDTGRSAPRGARAGSRKRSRATGRRAGKRT